MPKRKKIMVIGLDAWSGALVERLAAEGSLPTIKRLMDTGSYGRLAPFWPCATGNNWTSIITGASPAIHQCDFFVRLPGKRLDQPQLGFPSGFCKAEQLWQTASKLGLTSVVFDYPQSYPVNAERVIHIGEDGCPDNSAREVFAPWAYATKPRHPKWAAVMSKMELVPAHGWKNLAAPAISNYVEATLKLRPGERSERPVDDELVVLVDMTGKTVLPIVSLYTRDKDFAYPIGCAGLGEWTDWMQSEVMSKAGLVEVAFRANVLRMNEDASDVHIYLSQGYPVDGFTTPAALSEELVKVAGPYHHHGHTQEWVFYGACDLQTQLEQVASQNAWLQKAAGHVLSNYDWDVLALKWHDTDTFQHCAFNMIDPAHPLFDPAKEAEGWEHFRDVYGMGDKLVARLLECAGEDTVVAVVSDHGQLANTYFPDVSQAFADAGLTTYNPDGGIDLANTRAVMTVTGVHVNLKGLYEGGIVEPSEREAVCRKAIDLLRAWKHPETGEPAFCLVAKKEDLAFMGTNAPQLGDVIYMLNPIKIDRKYTEEQYEQAVMAGMWLTSRGTHGSHLPSQRFSLGGIEGICVLAGPGVKHGFRHQPYWTNSVAPTVCELAGLPVPKDADGVVIREAMG